MALIKCPKCGREISDKAANCIGCGWKVEPIKDSTNEQTTKLQHMVAIKKEKRFPDANILFMIALTIFMICFVAIVWRRLDKFETEIEMVKSSNQTESEILVDNLESNIEKIADKNSDDMSGQDTTGSINADNDIADDEQTNVSNVDENSNVSSETEIFSDDVVKVGNLEVDSSDHTGDGATYHLTDAAVLEANEKDNTVKVTVKGEVTTVAKYDRMGVYFKFLDNNGFELFEKLEYISGDIGTFTESFSDVPDTVASVTIK